MDLPLVSRYTGIQNPPAGLLVLAPKVYSSSGPIATMGSALPPDTIIPKGAGIYDENGMLRSMKRLWPDTKGLQRRRDAEASLFEEAINKGRYA